MQLTRSSSIARRTRFVILREAWCSWSHASASALALEIASREFGTSMIRLTPTGLRAPALIRTDYKPLLFLTMTKPGSCRYTLQNRREAIFLIPLDEAA